MEIAVFVICTALCLGICLGRLWGFAAGYEACTQDRIVDETGIHIQSWRDGHEAGLRNADRSAGEYSSPSLN